MTLQVEISSNKTIVPIKIKKNIIFSSLFINFLKSLNKKFLILTDKNIEKLYLSSLSLFLKKHKIFFHKISIPPGENFKNRKMKEKIEDAMLKKKFFKDSCIISLGGGVISDLSTFIAATYMRGIDLIIIPTTLLSMIDASIGGKASLNTPFGKNLIGTIYHPKAIFIDSSFLPTLPQKEHLNGIPEMIKHSLIYDKDLFFDLLKEEKNIEQLIYKNILIKKTFIEQKKREALNFGHTIGHSIEHLSNYKISHGEAVAIGMLSASYLSHILGFLKKNEFLKILEILKKYKFPLYYEIDLKKILKNLFYDKKVKDNSIRFILLEKIGRIKYFKKDILKKIDLKNIKKTLIWTEKFLKKNVI